MDFATEIDRMAANGQRIAALVAGVSDAQARWKPTPDDWSVLEVVNHLADEEREDFRTRLDLLLHHTDQDWPPINPQGWVTARDYNSRDLAESVQRFVDARAESLVWLRGLGTPDWETAKAAPWGPFRAGELFAAWVTHDALHMRQLVELHYAWGRHQQAPYSAQYAGDW